MNMNRKALRMAYRNGAITATTHNVALIRFIYGGSVQDAADTLAMTREEVRAVEARITKALRQDG